MNITMILPDGTKFIGSKEDLLAIYNQLNVKVELLNGYDLLCTNPEQKEKENGSENS